MQSKIELKRLIEKKPDDILDYLEGLLEEDAATLNLILTIKSSLHHIKDLNIKGTLSFDEYSRNLTKIRINILDIIDELPDKYFIPKDDNSTKITKSTHQANALFEVSKLLRELSKLNTEQIKLSKNNADDLVIINHMNIQRRIISDQIIKFSEIHKLILSGYEYTLIADVFQSTSDYVKAEVYYKKAIRNIDEYTDSVTAKITAIQSYAIFLYQTNRPAEGIEQFKSAILEGDSEQANILNGRTYHHIFKYEASIKNYESAIAAYVKSKACFFKIKHTTAKRNHVIALENDWSNTRIPPSYKRPL